MAEASTSLQHGQCSVILALARQCARVDPVTGAEPRSWQPLQFEEVLPYLPGILAALVRGRRAGLWGQARAACGVKMMWV
jgi:hypothetical protein